MVVPLSTWFTAWASAQRVRHGARRDPAPADLAYPPSVRTRLGLALLVVAALIAAWLALRGRSQRGDAAAGPDAGVDSGEASRGGHPAPPSATGVNGAPRAGEPTGPAAPVEDDGDDDADDGPRGRLDFGRAWSTIPPAYATKVFDVDSVAVNLHGAAVTITHPFGSADPPPALDELRGRVLDGGVPVAGALVLVAARFTVIFGHLNGEAMATTDASGRFALRAPVDATWALALGPRGWSAITPIPARSAGREVELTVGAAAGLEVVVVEDDAPLDATLDLGGPDGRLMGRLDARDGVFRFAVLPPGPIELRAQAAQEFASGDDLVAPVTVELRAGEVVTHRFALDSKNATVAVTPVVPDGRASTVQFALLEPPAPGDLAELRARAPRMPMFGGRDAANTYQFHRVTPAGPRVACAVARLAPADDADEADEPVVRWGCAAVAVPARGVVEVDLTIDRPPT